MDYSNCDFFEHLFRFKLIEIRKSIILCNFDKYIKEAIDKASSIYYQVKPHNCFYFILWGK